MFCALYCGEKAVVVIVPSYNNLKYYKANLDSILNQKYDNFRVIYVDDCSSDGMSPQIEDYLIANQVDYTLINFTPLTSETPAEISVRFEREINISPHFFTLVRNTVRGGPLTNIYRASMSTEDHEIITLVDGDDSFYDHEVLQRVGAAYSGRNEVWLTHGTLIEDPNGGATWCESVPKKIIKQNAFREFKCPSHLKTYYSWLMKKIDIADLLHNGEFFWVCGDMAIMFPMIEMTGTRHAFLKQVNYKYNMANEINENKVNKQLQNDIDFLIRHKDRYQPLIKDEIPEFMRRDK